MKQTNLIVFFLMMLAVSCTKKDKPVDTTADAEIQKLLDAKDFQSEVQIYTLMKPEVKYRVWYNHLLNAKLQFEKSAEQEKVRLINELLGKMSSNTFIRDSKEQAVFMNYFIPQWSVAARKEFSDLGFYDLIGNPKTREIRKSINDAASPGKNIPASLGAARESATPDCFCHVGQLGYSCSTTQLTFDISLGGGITYTITQGRCQKNNSECNYSSWGCGNFWYFSCGGNSCLYS